jgi:hypothetical protein
MTKGLQHASAFVIQFRIDKHPAGDSLPGRIEHVASGRTVNFQSIQELPDLLRRMLNDAIQTEGTRSQEIG